MGDERLLVRIRTASYAVPGGFPILVTHVGNCVNHARDNELVRYVKSANPKIMSELVAATKAVMVMMGCPDGCHIDKDNSAGILYAEHSQDSSFAASSGTTAGSTGTGALIGERLIEGAQQSQSGGAEITVGCVSQFSSSWPSGLSGLSPSEKIMYDRMKLDRSSDEDYVPSSVVVNDVAMTLGENKTSEANGLGDSRHATSSKDAVPSVSNTLPSTVPYSVSATQDILGALAEYEIGALPPRPTELDSSDDEDDTMDVVEQSAQVVVPAVLTDADRIDQLERGVEEDRDLFDRLRDLVEDLEVEVASLKKWKNDVTINGCSRCSGKPVGPSTDTRPAVPVTKGPAPSRTTPPARRAPGGAGPFKAPNTKAVPVPVAFKAKGKNGTP